MVIKYHINDDGDVGKCSATQGGCPFGGASGSEEHFETSLEARQYYESKQSLNNALKKIPLTSVKKFEKLYSQGELKLSESSQYLIRKNNKVLVEAFERIAKTDNNLTISELINTLDLKYDHYLTKLYQELYAFHINVDEMAKREDNLLNGLKSLDDWRDMYDQERASLLLEKGELESINSNYYGWRDWDISKKDIGNPIYLGKIKDIQWEDFISTFDGSETITGVNGEIVYETGYSTKIRYEGNVDKMFNELFKKYKT